MIKQELGIKPRTAAMLGVVPLLVLVGLGFTYTTHRISSGTLLFLAALMIALAAVTVVFLRRMNDSDESVEQMLYKADHPTRPSR
jgi:cyanate permease